MSFRHIVAAALLALTLAPTLCNADQVRVTIQGVGGDLLDNVMATLKIVQQKDISVGRVRLLHKHAPEEIKEALAPFGYYAVDVKATLSKEGRSWKALYEINAGQPVRIERVQVEVSGHGKDNAALSHLAEKFPLKHGDKLNDSRYEAGKKAMLNTALAQGYIRARFTESRVEVQAKKQRATIFLTLDSGPLHVFGETTTQQDIIRSSMLKRYLPYRVGDVYSLRYLNQLQSDLYATGYFSQVTVEPKLPALDDNSTQVPVELQLQPAPYNRYSFGAGYGTDTGARGSIGWKNRRINQYGHRPSVNVQLAEKGNRATAGYEIPMPIIDQRYDTLSFDTLYSEETWDDTFIRQLTLGTSLKHNAPKYQFGAGVEYLHESYTVGDTDDVTWLFMPNAFLTMILAENRVNTDNGIRVSGSVKGAHSALFSSTNFFQFKVGGKAILSPVPDWRLIGRASFGATAMESIDELPPSLRFYAGGDQSVRGYGYKELGPKNKAGRVVGGQYLTEASVELERKITGRWSAAVFYDLGNAYDNIDARLQQGVGVGARMTLPFGQLRFDVAEALSEAGFSLRIHLTLGADL